MRGSGCPASLHVFVDDTLEGSCGGTLGVSGLLLRAIRSLYNHSESLVCISNNMSDSFPGERQSAHSGQGELLPHMEEFKYSGERETDLYSDGNDADAAPICSFMSSL